MTREEQNGAGWQKELEEDVKAECEKKYGPVIHLALDENAGDIYVKFERVEGGEKAMQGLNGRFFGGRMITANPMVDAVYSSLFGRTKAG
jgi:RNA-binding protein 39